MPSRPPLTESSLSAADIRARFRASLAAEGVITRATLLRAIIQTVPAQTAQHLIAGTGLPNADRLVRDLRANLKPPMDEELHISLDQSDKRAAGVLRAIDDGEMTLEEAFRRIVRGTKDVGRSLGVADVDQGDPAEPPRSASRIQAILFGKWVSTHNLAAQYYVPRPRRDISDWIRDEGQINPDFVAALETLERGDAAGEVHRLRQHPNYAASPYGQIRSSLGLEASLVAEILAAHAFGQIARPPFDLFALAWTLEPLGPARILAPLRGTVHDMRAAGWLDVLPDDGVLGLYHRLAGSERLLVEVCDWLRAYEPLSAAEFRASLMTPKGNDA